MATVVSLDVQIPPLTVDVKVVELPTQTACEPDIVPDEGDGVTVIDTELLSHPVLFICEIS